MPPLVSINLCCYNSERFLDQTLQSIFAQTFADWELVIINDGSKDSTESIIQRHMSGRCNIVYHSQANAGLAASRNKALELSTGKYIALIDHDDVWMPEKLERQVSQLESNPRLGLSYTDAVIVDGDGCVLRPYMPHEVLAEGNVLKQLFLGDFIACSSVTMRRDVVDLVGPFRSELRITEEYDLFLRITERSEIGFIDSPLLKLRLHSSNSSWNFLRTRAENGLVLGESLRRQPALRKELGPASIRVRLAGFSCTPAEAAFLRRPLQMLASVVRRRAVRSLREMGRAVAKIIASWLPSFVLERILMTMAARRRRAMM